MAKGKNDAFWGVFMIIISVVFLISAIKMPLAIKEHVYVEGKIHNVETINKVKKRIYQIFNIKNVKGEYRLRFEGRKFRTYDLQDMKSRSTNLSKYLIEGAQIGCHIEKTKIYNGRLDIYSLTINGKTIVPFNRKSTVKYTNLIIGIFLLFGSFLLFKDGI